MKRSEVKALDWNGEKVNQLRLPETNIPVGSIYYMVKGNEPLDMIAWKFFKDESKWYLIADVNEISDPLKPMPTGTRLIIPIG